MLPLAKRQSVTVVGGGVAGIAAACALAESGYPVQLIEAQPYLGGRACSYENPATGEVIDNGQHVLLGCCTNLIDLYRRLGVEDRISWSSGVTFLEPGGRRSVLEPSTLPAPLHNSSLLKAKCFSTADKVAIAQGMRAFLTYTPTETEEHFADWLEKHHQPEQAVRRFWHPVLACALNEDPACISVNSAARFFREAFLFSPEGGKMGIPQLPLSELYGCAQEYIEARGGKVHLRTRVARFQPVGEQWQLRSEEEQSFHSDSVILAVPFDALHTLMEELPWNDACKQLEVDIGSFTHSPITSVHLWFDREITELTHAALLDTTIQWFFHKSKLQPAHANGSRSYVEVLISASKSLMEMQRSEIIDLALEELALFFPEVAEAVLVEATVMKEARATFSVRPMLDRVRPGAVSPWKNIYLAGDWTATGWPSTMESAARSGYMAAEALTLASQNATRFLVPDLQPTGWMRLFA